MITNFAPSMGFWSFIVISVIWSLIWKGLVLWRAARRNHKKWFVVLLLFNTLGVLDILYFFIFSKQAKYSSQISEDKIS